MVFYPKKLASFPNTSLSHDVIPTFVSISLLCDTKIFFFYPTSDTNFYVVFPVGSDSQGGSSRTAGLLTPVTLSGRKGTKLVGCGAFTGTLGLYLICGTFTGTLGLYLRFENLSGIRHLE
ncbi:hypothetical protein HHI36_001621 [Cryptolaemus montrouzieri]|uniref:Uncharacterized protein n=1 Tax=Cryptolaemus montrouzieri TaxID=559131 RepID=A0ABD2P8X4_9CUCU